MIKPLLDNKPLIEKYLYKRREDLSAFSFANISTWCDFFTFEFKMIDGNLCIFARDAIGQFLYLPPLGETISRKAIKESFAYMEEINKGSGVSRIENVSQGQLKYFPSTEFQYYKKGYEYFYFRKDLVGLKGNAYKSKRYAYNHFINNYKHVYKPYDESMFDGCMNLYESWATARSGESVDEIYLTMLEENKAVHRLGLKHYKELGLTGGVVIVDGVVKGYSFGFELNKDTFCILFEITDLNLEGLAAYIFKTFCEQEKISRYKFINVMDDCQLTNIGRVKMSYRPHILFPSYCVTQHKI